MKKIIKLFFITILLISCEDIVDIDTPETPPRLFIDALIRLDTSKEITEVEIRANLTSAFFGEITPAELRTMSILNRTYRLMDENDNNTILFEETSPGVYVGSKETLFFTEGELELYIEHNDQQYIAFTRFVPSSPILNLEQGDETLFSGDETEVRVSFTDNADLNNFYLVDFDFGEYLVTEDEFYNGQTFEFSYFYDNNLNIGQEVNISLLGVDQRFYNYMDQLIVQADGDQGPFDTPAATVRGNIINFTDIDNVNVLDNVENTNNFALGYFAICETFTETINIEER